VLKVLRRRAPQLAVTVIPVRVQGSGAAEEILEALQIAAQRADSDVILLTRGGGSIEDLAAFNDERLARAIAAIDIPVVSAVGHEIDFTITDFVADRRAPTPSAAAELISPDTAALKLAIAGQQNRLHQAMRRRLQSGRQELVRLDGRLQRGSPHNRLRQQQQRLDGLDLRLLRAMRTSLQMRRHALGVASLALRSHSPATRLQLLRQRYAALPERLKQAWNQTARHRSDRLTAAARQLHTVSPLATMQRGYTVLRRPMTGEVVSSVAQVSRGAQLEALLSDGRLKLTVD
jgi:exodeoxyribonuclease VII large subunit